MPDKKGAYQKYENDFWSLPDNESQVRKECISKVSTVFLISLREMKPRKNGAYIIVGKIPTLEKEITNSRGDLCSSNPEIWIFCTTEIS
jgi:hypothetical protein